VVFESDSPRNYVLNTNSALCVNTAFAYPYYIAPILFPKVRWLGLSPVLFGMGQAVGHGVIFPRLAGDKYSPGFLASALLHVPIGLTYIRAVQADRPLTRAEWAGAIAYTVVFAAVGVGGPNLVMRDKNSPHAFAGDSLSTSIASGPLAALLLHGAGTFTAPEFVSLYSSDLPKRAPRCPARARIGRDPAWPSNRIR
jgi:hypothetical protein